jgi:23S rRNA (adenine2503-C2)-methyltransferase
MTDVPHIFDLTPDELAQQVTEWGLPRFRAKQLLQWVYRRGVIDPWQMTDLSVNDREVIARNVRFLRGETVRHQRASDGTQKLLIDWSQTETDRGEPGRGGGRETNQPLEVLEAGGQSSSDQTECVMIPSVSRASGRERRTACISSQVGCPVGCKFCASGLGGLDRNLTAGQIVQQAWQLSHQLDSEPITNVVFMGMGEPLANFKPVVRTIETLTAEWGMHLSGRRITLSTVGLPAQIRRLAELNLPFTLAISLHAPDDDLRRQIIPWADFVTIEQLTDAGRYYFDRTGREVTLEYILLGGVNDQPAHAKALSRVAKKLRSNINLIRYNEVAGLPYKRPRDGDVHQFQRILQDAGIATHIRASRGRDIDAACGQLRYQHSNAPSS